MHLFAKNVGRLWAGKICYYRWKRILIYLIQNPDLRSFVCGSIVGTSTINNKNTDSAIDRQSIVCLKKHKLFSITNSPACIHLVKSRHAP